MLVSIDQRPDDQTMRQLLADGKTIAIVGLSAKAERDSNMVARYLLAAGYRIIPVNPLESTILGLESYADLAAVPVPIDIVDVFRRSSEVGPVAQQAIAVGAKALWLQLGVRNQQAEDAARLAGLAVVADLCIKVEHLRLLGGPGCAQRR